MTPRYIGFHRARFIEAFCLLVTSCMLGQTPAPQAGKAIPLPSSKVVQAPVPGDARKLNSFPAASALSPDGRYVAILNQGWGLPDSKFEQSIAILDLQTNNLTDYPDERLHRQKQTYFYGLAWSQDGKRLYASISSLTNPEGKQEQRTDQRTGAITTVGEGDIGNGISVYRFENGVLSSERFVKIPPQPIGTNKKRAEALKAAPNGTLTRLLFHVIACSAFSSRQIVEPPAESVPALLPYWGCGLEDSVGTGSSRQFRKFLVE